MAARKMVSTSRCSFSGVGWGAGGNNPDARTRRQRPVHGAEDAKSVAAAAKALKPIRACCDTRCLISPQ